MPTNIALVVLRKEQLWEKVQNTPHIPAAQCRLTETMLRHNTKKATQFIQTTT